MQIWKKVKVDHIDKQTALLCNALTNYIYKEGPIIEIFDKYKISYEDRKKLDLHIASKIAGLVLLYLGKDIKRINDIANKYNYLVDIDSLDELEAEIEGYVASNNE